MRTEPGASGLEGAISGMQALKAEHAPILAQIARDPGMSPETRATLIAHLLEEEDEKLAAIAAEAGVRARGPARGASAPPAGRGAHPARLTVGSLRDAPGIAAPSAEASAARRTVGSLRSR